MHNAIAAWQFAKFRVKKEPFFYYFLDYNDMKMDKDQVWWKIGPLAR
jgi:hypothetical protein